MGRAITPGPDFLSHSFRLNGGYLSGICVVITTNLGVPSFVTTSVGSTRRGGACSARQSHGMSFVLPNAWCRRLAIRPSRRRHPERSRGNFTNRSSRQKHTDSREHPDPLPPDEVVDTRRPCRPAPRASCGRLVIRPQAGLAPPLHVTNSGSSHAKRWIYSPSENGGYRSVVSRNPYAHIRLP